MSVSSPPLPAPARPAPPVASQDVLGVPLALTDYSSTLDWIEAAVAARQRAYICVAAVHTVMESQEDPALREAVLASDFTVPDGQPLVWAMNLLGHNLSSRVYGPDLMERACERAARAGQAFFLYGGRASALEMLREALPQRYPGLRVVGARPGPFRDLSPEEADAIALELNAAEPDVIWVGLGVPLQEKFMAAMRERLEAPVLVGVGAAFDFHAGLKRQAPDSLQRLGLEWAFRLAQEPRRLWRRYLRYNPRFVLGFARQYLRHLRTRRA
ncbi:MAG: N-acetylglucosaminyldiphosphoundecaprenol N-acetyl-beta-D-mannosaminyltransferase [Solirubrobacteraceae bacterium]|nr:N-acetylglucosaminyldiphosphoundecaprenol N-acetyl-beta-D-mannosaminyltransferase [Solirubrobacteraceae bacterium]